MIEVAEELGISAKTVRARHSAGWDLNLAVYTPLTMKTIKKRVLRIDLNSGEVLQEYESIGMASKDVGVDRSSISRCCSGKLKKSGGFRWRYADHVEN